MRILIALCLWAFTTSALPTQTDPLGEYIAALPTMTEPHERAATYSPSQLDYVRKHNVPTPLAAHILARTYEAAAEFDVPARLLIAIATKESTFRPAAKSPDGSKGLIQVREKVHRKRMVELGVSNIYSVGGNLRVGAHILKEYLDRAKGNRALALKRYSGGSSAYASAVLKIYRNVPT